MNTLNNLFVRIGVLLTSLFLFSCTQSGSLTKSVDPLTGNLTKSNPVNPFQKITIKVSQSGQSDSLVSTNSAENYGDLTYFSGANALNFEVSVMADPGTQFTLSNKVNDLTNLPPTYTTSNPFITHDVFNPTIVSIVATATDNATGSKIALEVSVVVKCEEEIIGDPFTYNLNGLALNPVPETPGTPLGFSLGGNTANFSGVITSSQLGGDVFVSSFSKDADWISNIQNGRLRYKSPFNINQSVNFYSVFGSQKEVMYSEFRDRCMNFMRLAVNMPNNRFNTDQNLRNTLLRKGTEIETRDANGYEDGNAAVIIPFLTALHNSNTPEDHATQGYFQLITAGFIPPGYVARNINNTITLNPASVSVLFEEGSLPGIIESVGNYSYRVTFNNVALPLPPNINGTGFPAGGVEKRYFNRLVNLEHKIGGEGDLISGKKYTSSSANGSIAIKLSNYIVGACEGLGLPINPGDPGKFQYTYIVHAIFTGTMNNSVDPSKTITVSNGEYYFVQSSINETCPGIGGGSSGGGYQGPPSD